MISSKVSPGLIAFLCVVLTTRAEGQLLRCDVLRTSDSAYAGRCERNGTTVALLVLRPPSLATAGRWYGTQARVFGNGGDTADVIDWTAFAPTFVDVGRERGIFNWCWCEVASVRLDSNGLHFEADPQKPAPASTEDVEILRLVRSYFPDSSRWNRNDTRNRAITPCPKQPAQRTLFCAMYEATLTVRGDNYWGPAGAAMQAALRAATSRRYRHPITEFNNDSTVNFDQFQEMLDDAVVRIRAMVATARQGGA